MPEQLVVKIAVGAEAGERIVTGLSVAAAAVASGVAVSLWLAGDAAWLGSDLPGPAWPDAAAQAEAEELIAGLLPDAGAAVCARCAQRRGITGESLRTGASIKGAAAFVAAIMQPGATALVY